MASEVEKLRLEIESLDAQIDALRRKKWDLEDNAFREEKTKNPRDGFLYNSQRAFNYEFRIQGPAEIFGKKLDDTFAEEILLSLRSSGEGVIRRYPIWHRIERQNGVCASVPDNSVVTDAVDILAEEGMVQYAGHFFVNSTRLGHLRMRLWPEQVAARSPRVVAEALRKFIFDRGDKPDKPFYISEIYCFHERNFTYPNQTIDCLMLRGGFA